MEKRKPLYIVDGNADAATMENSKEVPQKVEVELVSDPAIPLLGVYPKEMNSLSQRDICTPSLLQHYL